MDDPVERRRVAGCLEAQSARKEILALRARCGRTVQRQNISALRRSGSAPAYDLHGGGDKAIEHYNQALTISRRDRRTGKARAAT